MTAALKFQGIVLARSLGGSPDSYSAIAEITGFRLNPSAPPIDVTNADSAWSEKLIGIPDGGVATFQCNFLVAGGQDAVRDDFNSGTRRAYQITLTDSAGTKIRFSAYVSGFSVGGQTNGKLDGEVSLAIDGAVEGV